MKVKQATWWTPNGFVLKAFPDAFLKINASDDFWYDSLSKAGYEDIGTLGDSDSDDMCVMVYQQQGHYLIDLTNQVQGLGQFFVARQDGPAFFATWYLQTIQTVALATISRTLEKRPKEI